MTKQEREALKAAKSAEKQAQKALEAAQDAQEGIEGSGDSKSKKTVIRVSDDELKSRGDKGILILVARRAYNLGKEPSIVKEGANAGSNKTFAGTIFEGKTVEQTSGRWGNKINPTRGDITSANSDSESLQKAIRLAKEWKEESAERKMWRYTDKAAELINAVMAVGSGRVGGGGSRDYSKFEDFSW